MNKKRKNLTLIIVVLFILVAIATGVFLNSKFHFFADVSNNEPYIVFYRSTFEYVYSNAVPENSEIIGEGGALKTFAAQGEIEPITFSVRANQDIGKAQVTVSDLVFADSKISKDDIEIYNIKSWDQCTYDSDSNTPNNCQVEGQHITTNVPELLVKDNEQDLIADEKGWIESEKKYYPPEVNNTFNVNLERDKTYTFYLRIKTPVQTSAGKYTGKIAFTPDKSIKRDINLEFEVMPFALPQDEKDRLVYFNKRTSGNDEFNIGREMYEKYIDKIKEAGFNGLIIYQTSPEERLWTIDLLAEKGFSGPIVFTGAGALAKSNKITEVKNYAISKGFDPYFYGVDEPSGRSELEEHLKLIESIHNQGGKVFTAIRTECVEATDDPEFYLYGEEGIPPATQVTDLPNYAGMTDSYDCVKEKTDHNGKDRYSFIEYTNGLWNNTISKRRNKEYFYGQIWGENGSRNRRIFGFTTHRFGLDGSAPYTVIGHYSYLGGELNHGLKFYDDFDGPKKEYNTLYPSTIGPVLTLQWEGLREGIDDSRYATLLKQKISELKANNQDKATQLEQNLRAIIGQYEITAGSNISSSNITDATNQENRRKIADLIIEAISLPAPVDSFDNPPVVENINLSEGQIINQNPYLINAKVTDNSGVDRVEFYVDNNLIGVSTLPDIEHNYEIPWDTARYHSSVKVIAYDDQQNKSEVSRIVAVQLTDVSNDRAVALLPKTGEKSRNKKTINKILDCFLNMIKSQLLN